MLVAALLAYVLMLVFFVGENEKSGAPKSYNYLMVAGAYIKSVTCQSIMSQSNKVDLPPVDWNVVDQREQMEIEKLKQAISVRRHPGVSKSDQELFNRLKRIYGSCEWGPGNEIKVEGAVVKPPYSVNDVSGPEKLVEYIKRVCTSPHSVPLTCL